MYREVVAVEKKEKKKANQKTKTRKKKENITTIPEIVVAR